MILVLAVPDQGALENAAADFTKTPSVVTERALAATVQVFCERAELLAIYVAKVGGKPELS